MDLYSKQTKPYRYLTAGYVLLIPVILIWLVWIVCLIGNPSSQERVEIFYQIIPHYILNLDLNILMLLFVASAFACGLLEKKRQRVGWDKTTKSIRSLTYLSAFFLLLNILQLML